MTTPPSYVTNENVNFDGILTPSIVIENVTNGFQLASFGGTVTGGGSTGLSNDATIYTATVLVNDSPGAAAGTPVAVSVVGSAAQTYTNLIVELNADLGANATASIEGGNIKIESDTVGAAATNSSVNIADTAVGTPLFGSLTGFSYFGVPHDSGLDLITLSSLPAQLNVDHFTNLINKYGGVLPVLASAGVQTVNVGGAIVGGSATGLSNNTNTSGSQTVDVGGAVGGATATGLANNSTIYTANVLVDGVSNVVNVTGSTAQTYVDLVTELDADLTGATSSVATNDLVITSSSTGIKSKILIKDLPLQTSTGGPDFPTFGTPLFSSLTLFNAIDPAINGTSEIVYVADIEIDGVVNSVSIIGNTAQIYTDLLTEIDVDLTGATSAIVSGNVDITSSTTPTFVSEVSSINIIDGTPPKEDPTTLPLFASLTDFVKFEVLVLGVFNFRDALQKNVPGILGNDSTFNLVYNRSFKFVGIKPTKVKEGTTNQNLVYWDGTAFRFQFNDVLA